MNRTATGAARAHLGTASLLFFVSGWAALCYEVVWFKRATQLWGSSSAAMAAVVAAFLFGLGAGALLFGRIADRSARPLRLYGRVELGVAAAAALVPLELGWCSGPAGQLELSLSGSPVLLAAARFAVTLAVLGPACVLMGGTLPLMVRRFTDSELELGGTTSWLYALNTLGGAAGAWTSGFHLLPAVGLNATGNLAVLANAAAGFGALALARRMPARKPHDVAAESAPPPPSAPLTPSGRLLVCAALTGYASLALQMLWARQTALVVGGSTYAFTATITVFVLGLGAGSLLFRILAPRRERLQGVVAGASLVVVACTLGGLAAGPFLAVFAGEVRVLRANEVFDALLAVGVSAVFQGGATLAMGVLFPALVALARGGTDRAGRIVGSVYAANTLGAILGASSTCLLLLPQAGSFLGFRLVLACYVLACVLLFPPLRLPLHRPSLAAALACLLLLLATWHEPDPRAMNLGRFLMGNRGVIDLHPDVEVAFYEEGPTSNVIVLRSPEPLTRNLGPPGTPSLSVRVNGKVDATTRSDMPMQLALGYFPRFLRPEAQRTLVIGMGSGTTAGACLEFDDCDVVCCEIEPAMIAAARLFSSVNHRPHDSPRFRPVVDDGRAFLQATDEEFDLIVSEPSNPWVAGVGSLYTAEFYAAADRRLSPDGLIVQWCQTYSFTAAEYALVAETLLSVFPHCALLRINDRDSLLIAGRQPVLPGDRSAVDRAQALVDRDATIQRDLDAYFETTDVRSLLLEHVLLDENGLRRLIDEYGTQLLNTDSNLRLEFDAPRRLFADAASPATLTAALLDASSPRVVQSAFIDWGCGKAQVPALRRMKTRLFQHDRAEHARALVQLALAYDPEQPELLADDLLFEDFDSDLEFEIAARHLLELSLLESYRLGSSLAQMGRYRQARTVLEGLSAKIPNSAACWSSLAAVYASLDLAEPSAAAMQRASELDPLDVLTLRMQQALGSESE